MVERAEVDTEALLNFHASGVACFWLTGGWGEGLTALFQVMECAMFYARQLTTEIQTSPGRDAGGKRFDSTGWGFRPFGRMGD